MDKRGYSDYVMIFRMEHYEVIATCRRLHGSWNKKSWYSKKKNLTVSATVVLMSISGREENRHEVVDGAHKEKMEFISLLGGGVL